jgi:uncharacterized membrane protein (UPF0182 family)
MTRRRWALYAVGAAIAALFGGRWVAIRYTEASWYADLGLSRLFWARFGHELFWELVVGGTAAAWYAAQTLAVYRSIGAVHLPRRVGNLEIAEAVPRRVLRWIALAIAAMLGIVTAATFTDIPSLISLHHAAIPLNLREPVLGRDASFYLAQLPLLETLHLAALLMVLFGAFVASALYAMTGSITVAARRLRMTPHARVHLVALAALLALVLAWGFQLDTFTIVGGGGSAHGALDAADRAIRIPASTALAALSLVVSAGTAASLRRARPLLLAAMWGTLAVAAVLGRFVVPYLSDIWRGRPDPASAAALAQYADRYSRAGLGVLDGVQTIPSSASAAVAADSLPALARALSGLSPWEEEPGLLAPALDDAQPDTSRPRAWTATIDLYPGPRGVPVLAALAVPQTDFVSLERQQRAPGWNALHRGPLSWAGDPVAVVADAAEADGLRFLTAVGPAGEISSSPVPIRRAAGRIRFLALAAGPAVVGPDEAGPAGAPEGLRLGGLVRRMLFAWALQSPPLLERQTSVADRLLIWRDVPRRLARLYPFATFADPRAVMVAGKLLWLADGYLASARYPLADHVAWDGDEVSFLRAAYVATVDAVTGETRLYLRPPDQPFAARLAAGMNAPALPSDSMGAGLLAHLDYPEALFVAQAEMLARHRGDTGAAPRPWAIAAGRPDTAGAPRPAPPRPTVALLALGETGTARLWRLLPLADDAGTALVAIVAASARPDGTLALRLLRLPAGTFPTLAVAGSRISLSPSVVGAMARASGPEGTVRRSPVAVVPAAGTVAYVEFLFASSQRADQPLMPRGAAVLAGGRLGVGEDVASAVRSLASSEGTEAASATTSASLAEARRAFIALDSAVRRGDWARFGRAYETLRRALGVRGGGRRP